MTKLCISIKVSFVMFTCSGQETKHNQIIQMIDGYVPMRLLLKDKLKNDSNNLATFDKPQTFIHESDNDHTCWNNNTGTTPASKRKPEGFFTILSFSSIQLYQKAGGNMKIDAPSTVNKQCRQFVFVQCYTSDSTYSCFDKKLQILWWVNQKHSMHSVPIY